MRRCVILAVVLVANLLVVVGSPGVPLVSERVADAQVTEAAGFVSLDPVRLLDSRESGGAWGAGETRRVVVGGLVGVPGSGVDSVALHVTSVFGSEPSFMTVFPAGTDMPLAASKNFGADEVTNDLVVARLGDGGAIDVFNQAGSVHLVIDVVGYFAADPPPDRDPLRVVSVGDSYIAGTGNGNYYPGQGPVGGGCYQSFSSYPWQYVDMLNDDGGNAEIWHVACHGAHVDDVADQWSSVPDEWRPDADIILVSAGGNDAGFANIATDCLALPNTFLCDQHVAFATNNLDAIIDDLEVAVRAIAAESPDAKVVVVGYPRLLQPRDNRCLFAVNEDEIDSLQETHDTKLVSMIQELQNELGEKRFRAVLPAARFWGRGPCAFTNSLFHHITLAAGESFHPNLAGATEYASLLFDTGLHDDLPT